MSEELSKNAIGPKPPESAAEDKRAYQRSTIEFPYNDLDDAVEIAKAIHTNAGLSCTLDQLAAFLRQSMTSGTFRGRVASAGTFRLTEHSAGEVRLTDLGRQIVDSAQEPMARAESFMQVPLYEAVYQKYRGYTLPPASALEREMMALGVAAKQTDKARQAFMRSARQAGFFVHGEDRLVKPAFNQAPTTRPIEPAPNGEKPIVKSGGNEPPRGDLHPFIQGLLQTLPPPETEWPAIARQKWLQTAANIFDLIYKGDGGIRVEAATAPRSPRPD